MLSARLDLFSANNSRKNESREEKYKKRVSWNGFRPLTLSMIQFGSLNSFDRHCWCFLFGIMMRRIHRRSPEKYRKNCEAEIVSHILIKLTARHGLFVFIGWLSFTKSQKFVFSFCFVNPIRFSAAWNGFHSRKQFAPSSEVEAGSTLMQFAQSILLIWARKIAVNCSLWSAHANHRRSKTINQSRQSAGNVYDVISWPKRENFAFFESFA